MEYSSFTTYRHFCTGSPESTRKKGKSTREIGRSILKAENTRGEDKTASETTSEPRRECARHDLWGGTAQALARTEEATARRER